MHYAKRGYTGVVKCVVALRMVNGDKAVRQHCHGEDKREENGLAETRKKRKPQTDASFMKTCGCNAHDEMVNATSK